MHAASFDGPVRTWPEPGFDLIDDGPDPIEARVLLSGVHVAAFYLIDERGRPELVSVTHAGLELDAIDLNPDVAAAICDQIAEQLR